MNWVIQMPGREIFYHSSTDRGCAAGKQWLVLFLKCITQLCPVTFGRVQCLRLEASQLYLLGSLGYTAGRNESSKSQWHSNNYEVFTMQSLLQVQQRSRTTLFCEVDQAPVYFSNIFLQHTWSSGSHSKEKDTWSSAVASKLQPRNSMCQLQLQTICQNQSQGLTWHRGAAEHVDQMSGKLQLSLPCYFSRAVNPTPSTSKE